MIIIVVVVVVVNLLVKTTPSCGRLKGTSFSDRLL